MIEHVDDPLEKASSGNEGAELIRQLAESLPDTPGVYRMVGARGDVLYVGKARALRKRVLQYTIPARLSVRIQRMVSLTRDMVFVHTHTEAEALLLESNFIKKFSPRFNVLLKDDKSFPSILLTQDHPFPQVLRHRGARTREGAYFGPFAGAGDVNRTLTALQKAFLLRNCSDSVFANRTRPCLQYHIKRCTAPCVGKVDEQAYALQVREARDFLEGKSRQVQESLLEAMQAASAAEDFESAARLRDRIRALTAIQSTQIVNLKSMPDLDLIALARVGGQSCVQVFFFRGGQNFGNHAYFPVHPPEAGSAEILGAFLGQFYQDKSPPPRILISEPAADMALLETALSARGGRKISIMVPVRGTGLDLVRFGQKNAQEALEKRTAQTQADAQLLQGVAQVFCLPHPPRRIEVYDNSHVSGTHMVGAMIVAGAEGFLKKAYRTYHIRTAAAGDDFAMMREVLTRRFAGTSPPGEASETQEDTDFARESWPDLLLIDGGAGQFQAVRRVLEDMGLAESVPLVAMAKGVDRHAGREVFHTANRPPFDLPEGDPVLFYLQRLRDEAHRFAIGAHRARRKAAISATPLDTIPGIGGKRKRALLHHFGSAKAVANAAIKDLARVPGISRKMAETIYQYFR